MKKNGLVEQYLRDKNITHSSVKQFVYLKNNWIDGLTIATNNISVTAASANNNNNDNNNIVNVKSRNLLWHRTDLDLLQMATSNLDKLSKSNRVVQPFDDLERRATEFLLSNGELSSYTGNLPWEKRPFASHAKLINPIKQYDFETISRKLYNKLNEDFFNPRDKPSMDDVTFATTNSRDTLTAAELLLDRPPGQRHLLDKFSDSMLHVNRLYNDELGLRLRKVPAHTPHFVSVAVMTELQQR